MRSQVFETIIGALVLIVAIAFMWRVYDTTDISDEVAGSSYHLLGKFNKVDGLNLGADVKIGGIKIGKVIDLSLDPQTYQAVVKMLMLPE